MVVIAVAMVRRRAGERRGGPSVCRPLFSSPLPSAAASRTVAAAAGFVSRRVIFLSTYPLRALRRGLAGSGGSSSGSGDVWAGASGRDGYH